MRLDLLLVGFGNVARRFVELLDEASPALRALNITPRVVGIATGRHGSLYVDAGLDAVRAASTRAEGRRLAPADSPSPLELVERFRSQRAEARVLVETTPLDVRSGEPATTHVRVALASGIHVITANKGPVAFAYRELADAARAAGVRFLFEGAVMDGYPIFNLVRETLPAVTVRGFRGVVNSTTNYLLTALERGESFDDALERMRAAGITEADPSLDLEGWDAAAKTAALANVFLDARITPQDVTRRGVSVDDTTLVRATRSEGRRLKLVASARRTDSGVRASVSLDALDATDVLANLDGQANALELDTWPLDRLVITQLDGGLEKTAYALLTDLVSVART